MLVLVFESNITHSMLINWTMLPFLRHLKFCCSSKLAEDLKIKIYLKIFHKQANLGGYYLHLYLYIILKRESLGPRIMHHSCFSASINNVSELHDLFLT